MTLTPLLQAPGVVQVHAWAALFCLVPTCVVALARKGTRLHKAMGSLFLVLIVITALTSFWIRDIFPGSFSPIHLLSLVTLANAPLALLALRQGIIERHRKAMIGISIGLIAAGLFTMMPGRIMHAVIFGP